MNKMNTATVGLAVTPTVLSTFVSHVRLLHRACDTEEEEEEEAIGPEQHNPRDRHRSSSLANMTNPGSFSTANPYTSARRLICPTTRACTSFARSCSMSPTTPSRSCKPSRPNGSRTHNGSRSTT